MSLSELGRFAEAAEHEAEAIRLAEPTKHAFTICIAYRPASTRHLLEGNWVKARALGEHWIAVARSGNIMLHLPWAVASSPWALAMLGEASEALNRIKEGEDLLESQASSGIVFGHGWAYHALSRACLMLGRLDDARRLADHAVASSVGHPGYAAYASHLFGDIAAHPVRFDAEHGEACYQEALSIADRLEMRPLQARCHLGLGKLYRQISRQDETRVELTSAAAMLRELGMAYWLAEAEAELAVASR
jgi:tetratricopeptide (TPR) repeat protein